MYTLFKVLSFHVGRNQGIRFWNINSLWPWDAIWWHRTWSTVLQVMVCCLTVPSHYLNQCWLIVSEVLCQFYRNVEDISILDINEFENDQFMMTATSPRVQWVNNMASLFFRLVLSSYQHYSEVIMSIMASQITGVLIVCTTICSGVDQRKHQSFTSLAFVSKIHRWLVNSPHKRPVMWEMFPFDDFIMKLPEVNSPAFKFHI